jgi:hypothetical protein
VLQNVFLVRVVQQRRQLSALLSVLSVLPDRARGHPRHHQHSFTISLQSNIQINSLAKNQQIKLLGSIGHKTLKVCADFAQNDHKQIKRLHHVIPGGCLMESAKLIESAEINQTSEMDVEANVHELTLTGGSARQAHNTDVETAASSLNTSLRRVSEASTREIGSLVDEFHGLQKKLETDLSRIQRDVAEYTELSKGVMQLAATISDGMKKLPDVPGINHSLKPELSDF